MSLRLELYYNIEGEYKITHGIYYDDKAYDLYHLAMLSDYLYNCSLLKLEEKCNINQIPAPVKHFFAFALIESFNENVNIVELGSFLWEAIDGIDLINHLYVKSGLSVKQNYTKAKWHGIEISDIMRFYSQKIHSTYDISTYSSIENFYSKALRAGGGGYKYEILFDMGVSPYAMQSSSELIEFYKKFKVGIAYMFLSKKETFFIQNRVGKQMTYFALNDVISNSNISFFHIFETKNCNTNTNPNDCIEGWFLFATEKNYIKNLHMAFDILHSNKDISRWLASHNIKLNNIESII